MANRGRPQKPYQTSAGEHISGLARDKDGRWRIVATGERFTEADERLAVKRFRGWEAAKRKHSAVKMVVSFDAQNPAAAIIPIATIDGREVPLDFADLWGEFERTWEGTEKSEIKYSYPLPGSPFWQFLKILLLEHSQLVATNCGVPEFAHVASMPLPRTPLKLSDLIKTYEQYSGAKNKYSKNVAIRDVKRLMAQTGATTVGELTTEKLKAFKDTVEEDNGLKKGSSRAAIYQHIKTVIRFGLKQGYDAVQIGDCLARCKVLYTNEPDSQINPRPISRNNLENLLAACVGEYAEWKAWILLGLNCALKMIDVCRLRWAYIDFQQETYYTIREKRSDKKIPQAAKLWPQTIAALKAIKAEQQRRKISSPLVFISTHGTQWNRNGKGNDFRDFRTAIGAKREDGTNVCFDDLRDGAYTAAIRGGIDNRLALVMAGHRCKGYEDNYVSRDPSMVAPANAAVYKHYFG